MEMWLKVIYGASITLTSKSNTCFPLIKLKNRTSVGMFSAGYCYVTEEEEEENWEYFISHCCHHSP